MADQVAANDLESKDQEALNGDEDDKNPVEGQEEEVVKKKKKKKKKKKSGTICQGRLRSLLHALL